MYAPALNGTNQPVLIDFEGRQIGGGEWGVVDTTDDAAKAALDSERIVLVDVDPATEGIDASAASAGRLAGELEERRAAFGGLSAAELRSLIVEAGVLGADDAGQVSPAELVRMATRRTSIAAPAAPAKSAAKGRN